MLFVITKTTVLAVVWDFNSITEMEISLAGIIRTYVLPPVEVQVMCII